MQTLTFYVTADSTLGAVRDYANAKNAAAPTLTRGVSVCLKMRVFANAENADPYPMAELQNIPSWQFVMDDDFRFHQQLYSGRRSWRNLCSEHYGDDQ